MARTGSQLIRVVVAAICTEGVQSVRRRAPEPASQRKGDDFNATLALFDGIGLLEDLGFVYWYTNCSVTNRSRSFAGDAELNELRCGLGATDVWKLPQARPRRLEDIRRIREYLPIKLPFGWGEVERAGYRHEFPHATPPVAAPFAASQRFDISSIDFIVGGSLLYTLATGDFGGRDYTLQRLGGAVLIRRFSPAPDFVDLTNKGEQIKRLLTGKHMGETESNDEMGVQHLQVLRIGKYKVLFVTEVDAEDHRGRLVEIKSQAQPVWRQIIFQMISKGATELLHTTVHRNGDKGQTLVHIDEYRLRDIVVVSTTAAERSRLAANIIDGLTLIRARMCNATAPEERLFQMNASTYYRSLKPEMLWAHTPKLQRLDEHRRSLLPDASVLHELFPATSPSFAGMACA